MIIGEGNAVFLEIIIFDPSIFIMDHPDLIVSNCLEILLVLDGSTVYLLFCDKQYIDIVLLKINTRSFYNNKIHSNVLFGIHVLAMCICRNDRWNAKVMDPLAEKREILKQSFSEVCSSHCTAPPERNANASMEEVCGAPNLTITRGDDNFQR